MWTIKCKSSNAARSDNTGSGKQIACGRTENIMDDDWSEKKTQVHHRISESGLAEQKFVLVYKKVQEIRYGG